MTQRHISDSLPDIKEKIPVVTLTKPGQSGKPTYVKKCFSEFSYINPDVIDNRKYALADTGGFLVTHKGNLILN
jgi:hypothetical protein